MRFDPEKKKAIMLYLLEKIDSKTERISRHVAEELQISTNTVNTYLRELQERKIIRKIKRDSYELIAEKKAFGFKRSNGELDSDTYAFEVCLKPEILDFEKNVQDIWAYTFSEMVNNVMDHSNAENLYIQIKQDYLKTTVFILDDGVGIFEKIRDYFNLPSLDAAICELFKGKLTTDSANHSGEGIFFSSRLMDQFFILSGGKVFTHNKYDTERIFDTATDISEGTCVLMSLSNFSQKFSREVFDAYSNVDGGFTKTRIPLKNIFDTSPVSRSQAKRICNRLERFEEIILDFEGIDWMGQGFAHQIFVVFQKEHPTIKIVPSHMNSSVEKMYAHVMAGDTNK